MRAIVVLSFLAAPLAAQSFTSPRGLELVEGNTTFSHWGAGRRFQQVDNSSFAKPALIRSFAVRRNGGSTGSAAKTLDFTLDLGECDFGVVSQDLDANFLPGTRRNVVPQTKVNFPDWTAAIPGPAPFDFVVPLAMPFVYSGIKALVIDFLCQNPSPATSGTTDRDFTTPGGGLTGVAGTLLGTGCISTGQAAAFKHETSFMNQGALPDPRYALRFQIKGDKAPAAAPVFLFLDVRNQNLAGLACTTIYALPLALLTLTADAAGRIPDTYFGFPYSALLEGAVLYTQLMALDAGQPGVPLTLSNGVSTTIPAAGSITQSHPTTYCWYTLPSATDPIVFFGGGMVIQLGP